MKNGFTFNDRHSSEFGITYKADSRVLLPEKRRSGIMVPGRSGAYYQYDGAYNAREETFTCYFQPQQGKTTAITTRNIAGWLSGRGRIIFDDEPDKYYIAVLAGAPPLDRHLKFGEFELTFLYNPPFAFSIAEQIMSLTLGTNRIQYKGTEATPARIIITNNGTGAIQTIKLTAIKRRVE